jgi:hypothetical protein
MHFGTFPVLTGTPSDFQKLVLGIEVVTMTPGVTAEQLSAKREAPTAVREETRGRRQAQERKQA